MEQQTADRTSLYGAVAVKVKQRLNRLRYLHDPVAWVRERAKGHPWSKQCDILESIRDNRKTAVRSCHGPGKSWIAAEAVAWWLDNHPPGEAAVVTTAPSDRQVKVILWKEIRKVHKKAGLVGRTNQKEWLMTPPGGEEQVVAFGMKPSDYDPAAFQGIHARWVLVIVDEACGIPGRTLDRPQSLWDAADSLLANDECRILALGNPDDPTTEFARICKPNSGWHVLSISAFETPNFTGESLPLWILAQLVGHTWVEEKRKEWAPGWHWNEARTAVLPPEGVKLEDAHPLWLSKVLGRFPENKTAQGLIPLSWIEAAQQRDLQPVGPNELGVDMGAGGDASTIAHRRGPVVRIIHEDHNPDTMQTCGNIVAARQKTDAALVKVDKIGIGAGVVDRGAELREPFIGVNVGEKSNDPERFANLKAEYYWGLRTRFETGDVDLDPEDEATAAELLSIRYRRNSRGQIFIESKEDMMRRGLASPNRAEAVMLVFASADEDSFVGAL